MIKIAICDDEQNIRSCLAVLVRRQMAECEITEYGSAEKYLEADEECDILFLDIELADQKSEETSCMESQSRNMNGMELAKRIRSMEGKQPILIFVTGHEKYVYDAFDVEAFHYLVKPVEEGKFAEVFLRARKSLECRNAVTSSLCGQDVSEAGQPGSGRKAIVICCGSINRTILVDEILYIEGRGHKVALHQRDGELVEYYARIRDLEEELQGIFFRIHKGYLLNLSCVERYGRTEVMVEKGDRIPISKYKYEYFVKAHMNFLKGKIEH